MGKVLEAQKKRFVQFKATSPYFSNAAREDGLYRGKAQPFCLPRQHAKENLYRGIRESSRNYFDTYGIKWHNSCDGGRSNHPGDSQDCCVNFLFPLADKFQALPELLQPLFPDISHPKAIEPGQLADWRAYTLARYPWGQDREL